MPPSLELCRYNGMLVIHLQIDTLGDKIEYLEFNKNKRF